MKLIDISNKMQAVVIVEGVDLDDVENFFRVEFTYKMYEFYYLNLYVGQHIFIYGYCLGSGLILLIVLLL